MALARELGRPELGAVRGLPVAPGQGPGVCLFFSLSIGRLASATEPHPCPPKEAHHCVGEGEQHATSDEVNLIVP